MKRKTNHNSKRMMGILPENEKEINMPDIEYLKEIFLKSGGFISHVAKVLNISANKIYYWLEKSDELTLCLRQIRESYLDLAELKLIEKVRSGNLGAICFYLKCQGKSRGWVERHEITGEDGKDSNVGIIILPENKMLQQNNDVDVVEIVNINNEQAN